MKSSPQVVCLADPSYKCCAPQDPRKDLAKKLVKRRFREKIAARRNNVDRLYRNPSMNPYCGCWFVDNRDTVMACSSSGTLDIIRLQGEVSNDKTTLECSLKLGSFPSSSWLFRHFECRSYGRGQSIAVGMPTGDLQLFDTEYGKVSSSPINPTTWWRKGRTNQFAEKKICLAANHTSSFIRQGWTARRAMRRYHGKFASLQEQIDDPFLSTALPEIYQWDNLECHPLQSIQCWDFWEHSGNIQALHMGDPHDYFGVTLCDTRLRCSQNAIFFSAKETKDTMMNFKGGCFLSERSVATIQENLDRAVVCLWDLRNTRSSCSEIVLPSYPRDYACPSSPFCSYGDLAPPRSQYLTRYTLSAVRGGRLLVSTLVTKKSEHLRHDFQVDTLRGTNMQCIKQNYVGSSAPTSAVCPEMDCVVTFHESNFEIDELLAEDDVATSCRKRKFETNSSQYQVELTDRLGTSTTLNHLSFNEDGSCLCGASIDGDVFVWKV